MEENVECPYCGKSVDICHDDGFGYEECVYHQMQCCYCHKNFVFTTTISFDYWPKKADCLNGFDHNYEITHTCPREYSRMRCTMCDDTRELTEEERILYKINR
jgi:hypothetical protein